jgi:hypothetical protein
MTRSFSIDWACASQRPTRSRLLWLGTKQTIGRLRHSAKLAAALWLVLAFVVWNVVFDRVLVLAGRRYTHAAAIAVREGHPYLRIDDWMRPAVSRGVRLASATALGIAVFGLTAVVIASRVDRKRKRIG